MDKETLEKIYRDAFAEELKARANEGYKVVGTEPDGSEKVYEDTGAGKFYLCGFANLHYDCRTPAGRAFHRLAKRIGLDPGKDYYGGFNISLDSAKGHGNGMFEIMVSAYEKVAEYLQSLGYPVSVQSRLD